MEGTADVNASVEDAVQDLHHGGKESNQFLQMDNNSNVLGAPSVFISPENDWVETHSLLRSSKDSDSLKGKSLPPQINFYTQAEQLSANSPTSNGPNLRVEELTLNNYNFSHLIANGCSNRPEENIINRGQWQHFYQLSGGHRIRSPPVNAISKEPVVSDRREEDVRSIALPRFMVQNVQRIKHVDEDHHTIAEHLESDSLKTSSSTFTGHPGERRAKVSASGFSQFFKKQTLKGKESMKRHLQTHQELGAVNLNKERGRSISECGQASNRMQGSCAKLENLSEYFGARAGDKSGNLGVNLREWLQSGCQRINKIQSLRIFKQILELVDGAHSQGVALKSLKPSSFMILSSNRVKYVGTWVPDSDTNLFDGLLDQDANSGHCLKRKLTSEDGLCTDSVLPGAGKQQKLVKHVRIFDQNLRFGAGFSRKPEMSMGDDRSYLSMQSPCSLSENQVYKTGNLSGGAGECLQNPQLICEGLKLEDRWYKSPEDLGDSNCTLESNIYSLGVLLFELFCCFESKEMHIAAMSDLRHRILPPCFLSENPKEAGFCLWLVHPEPSSRPNTRKILKSELMCEGRDLSSVDKSSSLDEEDAESELLLHFLVTLKEEKQKLASKLVENIGCLDADIKEVEKRHSLRTALMSQTCQGLNGDNLPLSCCNNSDEHHHNGPYQAEVSSQESKSWINETRLTRDIKQLEKAYFSVRFKFEHPATVAAERSDNYVLRDRDNLSSAQNDSDWCVTSNPTDRLGSFFNGICKYARYSKFEVLGILRGGDLMNPANVICSLSFDRDEDYFAAAGVSKRIKIFEYGSLLNDTVDIHYPVVEMSNNSKLSCVSWNNYIKNYIASTDYEGVVQLWDAGTGQGFSQYKEHKKRAWSVDFSQVDPTKLASGSDDCSVKLWSINEANSISTIRNAANVCCVQFSSHSTHLLSFGSADYKIYCYDLRKTRAPWCVLTGHERAVSYVKFLDPYTLVSSSTDNSLKIWDLNKTISNGFSTEACSMTLSGHTNEKNFVGLSVSDGYIACGSETNEVYAYHKSLPMPMTSHKFGSIDPISGQETVDDNGQFVSSVCWRGKSDMVVAANSSGYIKLLRMV